MARKESLKARYERDNQPLAVQVLVSGGVLGRVDVVAGQLGKTRGAVLEEAVGEWLVRWESKLTRRDRLGVEAAMRENARESEPLGPLLARFADQMEKNRQRGLTGLPRGASLRGMEQDGATEAKPQIAIRVDQDVYDRVAEVARREERSMSWLLRKAIDQVLAEYEAAVSEVA